MFRGRENEVFEHIPLFYKEWTDEASRLLIEMDSEFFMLLDKLGVHTIPKLLEYYECSDATSLTRKLSSIPAFQRITSPMKHIDNGWVLDRESRFFIADFPYGLRWIYDLAHEYNVDTPVINKVYKWGLLVLNL